MPRSMTYTEEGETFILTCDNCGQRVAKVLESHARKVKAAVAAGKAPWTDTITEGKALHHQFQCEKEHPIVNA